MLTRNVRQKLLVVASCGVFLYLFLNLDFDFLVESNAQDAESALTTVTTTTTTIITATEESEEELDFLEFMVFREGEEEEEEAYAVNSRLMAVIEDEERNLENKTLETQPISLNPITTPPQKPTPVPRNATRFPLTEFPSVSDCGSNSDPSRVNKSVVYPCKHWHHVNKKDKVWPVILKPSNGKILQWLSKRRYDDPEVRIEGYRRTYTHFCILFSPVLCCLSLPITINSRVFFHVSFRCWLVMFLLSLLL